MYMPVRLNTRFSASVIGVLVATLAACGGKNPAAPGNDGNPVPGAAPTAVLVNSNATATALATEAKGVIDAAIKRQQAPTGILLGLPTGTVVTTACTSGGNTSYDYPTTFKAGTTYTFSYNSCSYAPGYVINGSMVFKYSAYTSATTFTWTATYNLTYSGPNYSYTYTGTQTCGYVSGTATCTFSEGGRTFESSFTYTGSTVSGTYTWTYGDVGTVRYTMTSWGPTSGTITVLGASGTSATITRTGASTFTVVISGTSYVVAV